MSKFTTRFVLLLSGLLLTSACAPAVSAVEINPYATDTHAQQLWDKDVADSDHIGSTSGFGGNFNLSAKPIQFSCTSTKEDHSTSVPFIDQPLFASYGSDLLTEIREGEISHPVEEANVTTEVLNLPIPEPSSLAIWILLGLCAGLIIRRRTKSQVA